MRTDTYTKPVTRVFTAPQCRLLDCDICETPTAHALTRSGDEYVCGMCGHSIAYHINEAGPGCAMDLRESRDAQERFNEWTADNA